MKMIIKTTVLTFTFCFLFFITSMLSESVHHEVMAFPVSSYKPKTKQLPPIPLDEYVFTKKQEKQIDCLTKNMYHEAKGEGEIGWLAVGMVTMNRVESEKYPDTICEVVYQNNGKVYQFSWVGTKKRLTKPKNELYNEIYELAVLIYLHHDKMYDVTDDALFFHADYVSPYWKKKFVKTATIGKHIFYKP